MGRMNKADMNFDEMLGSTPGMDSFNSTEEPDQRELNAYNKITDELLMFIHGPKSKSVVDVMKNSPNLYQGVGQTAFQILLSIKEKEEKDGEPIPPAALWGEGAAIQTAVDELFQLARAAKLPESENPDSYTAAMFEVYRLAGEYIQNRQDDDSVNEAQDLLVDVESSTPMEGPPEATYGEPHKKQLDDAIQRSLQAQQGLAAAPTGPQGAVPPLQGGEQQVMPPQQQQQQPVPAQGGGGILGV